jgi:hypothetical protein
MVVADRDLRLHGYEIYRFGANELVRDAAPEVIARFFERLFKPPLMSAIPPRAVQERTSREVREEPILLQNYFEHPGAKH